MTKSTQLGLVDVEFFAEYKNIRIIFLGLSFIIIITAKPMVQFGCPNHQKVYQGHKKVSCEFCTQLTRNLAQLHQLSPNKKWKSLTPHQLPKNQKNIFFIFSYDASWQLVINFKHNVLYLLFDFAFF